MDLRIPSGDQRWTPLLLRGAAADRPVNGQRNLLYFARDTDTLSIWDDEEGWADVSSDVDLSGLVESVSAANGSIVVDVTDPQNPKVAAGVYVWNGSAYVLTTGRRFVGPVDPATAGFTVANGDWWADTST